MRTSTCLRPLLAVALLATLAAPGCSDDQGGGPTMKPGENCLGCHDFSFAGTVFPAANADGSQGVAGAQLLVVDSAQKTVRLTSNAAGNFYTSEPLSFPIQVTVQRGDATAAMPVAPKGSCNDCHKAGNRVHVP